MAGNLTTQVRDIAQVTTAVAKGDLSQKIDVAARGEILELKNTVNTMVDQLSAFADEVTRVAREVGTEGRLGGQAQVPGVAGTWRDLTDYVNSMAGNLTAQVRDIAQVTTAVAKGDLSQKITVDARGEILELKNTINTMVDQLSAFADEVTRVAREVGTEGRLGGQADVKGVAGHLARPHRLGELHGRQPDRPGPQHRRGDHRGRQGRPDPEDRRRRPGRDPRAEERPSTRWSTSSPPSPTRSPASPARSARRATSAARPRSAASSGTWKDLTDNVNVDGLQPDQPGALHRPGRDRGGRGRPVAEDHGRGQGRDRRAGRTYQHDGRHAARVRRRGHPRRPRGRHRGHPRRPGPGARRGRHLEGPDRQRQLDGEQPDQPGPQHRAGDDRGRPAAT